MTMHLVRWKCSSEPKCWSLNHLMTFTFWSSQCLLPNKKCKKISLQRSSQLYCSFALLIWQRWDVSASLLRQYTEFSAVHFAEVATEMDDGMSAAGADAASVLWCKKVSEVSELYWQSACVCVCCCRYDWLDLAGGQVPPFFCSPAQRGRGLVFLFDLSAAAAAVAVVASTAAKAIISSDGQAGCH